MKKYIRSERANLFEPNVYISMVVNLSGDLTEERIRQAVQKAYEANETTMSKIVLEDNGVAFYEKMEKSGCKFFADNLSWKELLHRSEESPFALNEGELVRIFFTKEKNRKILLIHAHHLVGDGQSVLILLKDIVNSLDHQTLTYKSMISVDRKYLNKRAGLSIWMKPYINYVNRKWKKNNRQFTWEDYHTVHRKYWNEYKSEIEWKSYDINKIKEKCVKGVTINSYMIAELLGEFQKSQVVGIPVSIRESDGMSNQTSAIVIKYHYDCKKSLVDNATGVHKAVSKTLKKVNKKYFILLFMERLCPTLTDAVILQSHQCYQNPQTKRMAEIMGYTGDGGRDLGVTNLNIIKIPKFHEKFEVRDILFVPPKISYTRNVIGISTYADTLTVCYHKMRHKDLI